MKKLTVILIFMVCITGYISPTHAAKSVTFIITQQQLDAIIEGLPNLGQLQAIKNIDGAPLNLGVGILPGRFAISFRTKKTATSRPDFYYIVLLPTLQNGKINCTIDRIWLKDKWLTRDDLSKPNPYLTSTNGDAYCTMFLTPFLAGYGPGAMVTQLTLGYTDLTIAVSGDLALGAPPPSVVAGCKAYWWLTTMNIHSAPDMKSPIIGTIPGEARVLGWKHGWFKVEADDGTVGWVTEDYSSGGDDVCYERAGESHYIWEVLDTSEY